MRHLLGVGVLTSVVMLCGCGDPDGPLPDKRFRDTFPTLGHAVLHILAGHVAVHVGQLGAWRRAMGMADGG